MNEREVHALDRDLDALTQDDRVGTAAADREDVLKLLAMVPDTDWPDRAIGEMIAEAVAVKVGAERSQHHGAPVAAIDHTRAHVGLKIFEAEWAEARSGIGAGDASSGPARIRRPHLKEHRPAMRRAVALASAAAVAFVAAITAMAIRGGTVNSSSAGGPPQVYHSRFAATVLSGHSEPAPKDWKLAGGWQLASYLSTPGWHANDIGTSPISLSCPTTSVCYMIAARPVPVSGFNLTNPQYNLLEVSQDGGASWTTLSLPSDISITTPLQCPVSAASCYAAGYDAGRVVLLATTNSGQSWSARQIPGSLLFADALACTSDGSCVGLFEAKGWAPGYYLKANDAKVLATRDGGLTWSPGPPTPHGQLPDYLACGGTTCVLFDQLITEDNSQSVNGGGPLTVAPGSWAAWYSHDGGATWHRGKHPDSLWTMASHDLPQAGTMSCSDRLHCWAAMSSQIGEPDIATAFAATSDGGATWVTQSLPVQRARQFIPQGMSCPTARQCYAAGGDSAGPVILTTWDGGTIWSPVNLPKTNTGDGQGGGAAHGIGPIACAAASRCVAAPENSQSAHWVPIYSLGSS
jgi:hypothetical protein